MKVKPITHFTADGKEVIIREATEEDAVDLIGLKKSYIRGTRTIPLYEFEYKNDIQMEKDLIKRFHTEENSLLLVAEHGNNLIGNIDLSGNQRTKLFHTGMIGMGIANEWQNRKIGSFLMESLLGWAAESSPLKIIWLEVYSTNIGGIRLYEKFGFESCGHIKNFFMEEEPADKITMVKYLT
ncbi:GNAT family N-acetyltransferase [Flavobacterium sp. DGU11]|uniref:GNAT family N-acetyltransferase n=1 Tax=Flavobacterium arundinis TaxID=3139143 RepID=A0ABU9HRI2_9FLAO